MPYMNARSFLDSNILVYTDSSAEPVKRETALRLYARCRSDQTGVVSTQVLQEYFVAATRKLKVPSTIARRKVELFANLEVVQVRTEIILAAIDLQQLHRLSFWDSLIVSAAIASGCSTLYSEDMQDGFRVGGLQIRNPFLEPSVREAKVEEVPY